MPSKITREHIRRLRAHLLETASRVRIKRNGEVWLRTFVPSDGRGIWRLAGFEENLIDRLEWEGAFDDMR